MIIVVGGIVGFIVISMCMPLFTVYNNISIGAGSGSARARWVVVGVRWSLLALWILSKARWSFWLFVPVLRPKCATLCHDGCVCA
jgi:hypothetical protein